MNNPSRAGRAGPLAPLLDRWFGQFLDGIIYAVLFIGPLFLFSFILDIIDPASDSPLANIPTVVFLGPALFYLFFQDGLAHGRSWGKKSVKTRVIDARTGRPCTYTQSLIRNTPLLFLGFIDWCFIFSADRQRLGDRLAHTLFIKGDKIEEQE
jgi:uncharacterized RDD family membrane protein YckC